MEKRIVISGYYGSKNAGDEAMLAAMLEVLKDRSQKLHITVISSNPTPNSSGPPELDCWLCWFSISGRQ